MKTKDSERLDSESERRVESTPSVIASNAKQSIKMDSEQLESVIVSESQKGRGGDSKGVDCHDSASAESRNDGDSGF